LVTDEHHVVLRFPVAPRPAVTPSLVERLASALPEFSVFESGGSHDTDCITVKKVIAAEDVQANEAQFVAALRLFRQTASALASRLARRLGVPADRLLDLGRGNARTGWADRLRGLLGRRLRGRRLDGGWSYCFHGGACHFEDRATGQVVEVRLTFGAEFGVLDPYFFALFVKSTPALAHLAPLLRDEFHDAARVLKLLHRAGHLRVVEGRFGSGLAVREEGHQPGEGIPPGGHSMTEDDWDRCSDPTVMLRQLGGHASDRKLRLFLCAWSRHNWARIPDEQCRLAVETGERWADGLADEGERAGVYWPARDAAWYHITRLPPEHRPAFRPPWDVAVSTVAEGFDPIFNHYLVQPHTDGIEREQQCHLLRDIFGPLFCRDVSVAPSVLTWNDGLVRKLAQSVYDQRKLPVGTLDVARLAVLADALEEAGCTNQVILSHCRNGGTHVRGCWAVDLILGKQ
jgi:hypothetical protein